MSQAAEQTLVRPDRLVEPPLPPLPEVGGMGADEASTTYSHYRTGLSHHRTELSEHRTDLSEFRTDLSMHRTALSTNRTEMSMRRTGMSIQRTRMSADRTLMSIIRTSLSLIGFGFTIQQAFAKLRDAGVIHNAAAPRNFGLTLIVIGVLLLAGGLAQHVFFALELRARRGEMTRDGLIHGESAYPVSITFLTALALLIVGVGAAAGIVGQLRMFG